jgi:hypothetical protein
MTVKELREQLQGLRDDQEVMFAYNYGDHWDTEVCEGFDSVERMDVVYSDYHERWRLPNDDADSDGASETDDERTKEVVVLR